MSSGVCVSIVLACLFVVACLFICSFCYIKCLLSYLMGDKKVRENITWGEETLFLSEEYGGVHVTHTHTHTRTHTHTHFSEVNVQNVRTCWRIIYMFVCSATSCLGVVNIDIDQNHQQRWSRPGSAINEVRTCQLNPGQREEANVCFSIAASSQRGLGSGLTPGLTALPDHMRTWGSVIKMVWNPPRSLKRWLSFFVGDLCGYNFIRSAGRWKCDIWTEGVIYTLLLLPTDAR